MKILSGVYWNAGAVKEINQDTVALQQVVTPGGRAVLALVCDGIGGLPQGEVASGYAAEEIVKWYYRTGIRLLPYRKGRRMLKKSVLALFARIQRELAQYGEKNQIGIGSTVTLLLLWRKHYRIFHLGDSRVYLCRENIQQLTDDHGMGRVLTRCMGSFGWQRPDILRGRVGRSSGLLLCTDGFRNRIEPDRLAEALNPRSIRDERQLEARLREVAEYSMKNGEQDNISAIYLKNI